jgi:hypothetical protein
VKSSCPPLVDRRQDPSSMSSRFMTTEPHTVLFGWTRTGDQDVYQSSGALLPITAGAYIGNVDHRPKKIGGVNISSHIAALFHALHQLFDCYLDQAARTLMEPGKGLRRRARERDQ